MADLYISGITTAFRPGTTCIAPSNLWLTTMPCGTQWSGEELDFADEVDPPICTVTMLGPPDRADRRCYGGYDYHQRVNDCPVGMTSAHGTTQSAVWMDGLELMTTFCCPSAYEFASRFDAVPDAGEFRDIITTFFCRADRVKTLSDQTATLTVSIDPLITTEVAWDYEKDYIYAYSAAVSRSIYYYSGTISQYLGLNCPDSSDPLAAPTPAPTPRPTRSYIPPPSHPTTQFSPAPSCIGDSHMYLVSTSCIVSPRTGEILTPDWLECSITEFGEWNTNNAACYGANFRRTTTIGDDGTATFYAGCPAGYTTASETTYRPFDKGVYTQGTSSVTESFDVVVSAVHCCPGGDYSFKLSDVHTTQTSRADGYEQVYMFPMPRCVVQYVEALSGKDVELTLAENSQVWDKRKRQEATQGHEVTTRPWDDDDFLFAEAAQAEVTVFHGTYSCYENCEDYFTYSYNNTDPNYTPTSATASSTDESGQGGQGEATQTVQVETTQTGQEEVNQASGISGTVRNTLFSNGLGTATLLVTILSVLS